MGTAERDWTGGNVVERVWGGVDGTGQSSSRFCTMIMAADWDENRASLIR